MNAALLAAVVLLFFGLALKGYSVFLDRRLFNLSPKQPTPSHTLRDDVDYCPAPPLVLFGHHFASICGLGPIVGPAIAAIWGWLPALLWIVFGVVFIGAAHDFGSLVLSLRYQGRSIGDLTADLLGPRARLLFLILIFFMIALAMGLFASIIATLFDADHYPSSVLPSFLLIGIAVIIGYGVFRKGLPLGPATAIGLLLMLGGLAIGHVYPVTGISQNAWIYILLAYAGIASSLPVWILLQPRDYLNSFLLYLGIGLIYFGVFKSHPQIVAPAINQTATDLPSIFPFLFITVACGAVSGFHSLVCSGTTSKQIDKEPQARIIGYGGMLAEGVMALAVLLACTAAMGDSAQWHAHYSSWGNAQGLGPSLGVFIDGAAIFISQTGLSVAFSATLISVIVVGFALTTLDSATRLLRYNLQELGAVLHLKPIQNRWVSSGLAILAIGYFALMDSGKTLWQLFGTTNQLLAALALLAISTYLFRRRKPVVFYLLPMLFMLITTLTALTMKASSFAQSQQMPLFVVSGVIIFLTVWLVTEAIIVFASNRRESAGP